MTDSLADISCILQSTLNQSGTFDGNSTVNISDCLPASDTTQYLWQDHASKVIRMYYPYVILCIGLPGNIMALITFCRMKSPTSPALFMATLTVFDSLILIAIQIDHQFMDYAVQLHDVGCQFMRFIFSFLTHVSNWIVVVMTFERCFVILSPFEARGRSGRKKVALVVSIISLLSVALGVQNFITRHQVKGDVNTPDMCMTKPQYEYFRDRVWVWVEGTTYGFLPVVIVSVLNGIIIVHLRISAKRTAKLTSAQARQMNQQRQVTFMLVSVSVVFMILILPNCVLFISEQYWDFQANQEQMAIYNLVATITFVLMDLNSAINFYLYFLSGRKFRQHFLSVIFCKKNSTE